MPKLDIPYEQLPQLVKDNLSPEQWERAQRGARECWRTQASFL